MQWDDFQAAVLDNYALPSGHTVVRARAGAGKTTVAVAGLERLPTNGTTLMCAFNRRIYDELKSRAPWHVAVKTLHQLGLLALRNHTGRTINIDNTRTKSRKIANAVLNEARQGRMEHLGVSWPRMSIDYRVHVSRLLSLTSLAKNSLVKNLSEVVALGYAHGLDDAAFPIESLAPLVAESMKRTAADLSLVDFDDMIYLPAKLGAMPPQYDFVLVDEAQDVNVAQLWLSRVACRGRYIATGDEQQAIYLFRGADSDSMPRITRELQATTLPMSVTYRCAKDVVKYVTDHVAEVADLRAAPHAEQGEVEERKQSEMLGPFGAQPGDFILSRLNAPLMPICLHFLKHGVPCVVAGKDIGDGLVHLLERMQKTSTVDAVAALKDYVAKEYGRLEAIGQLERWERLSDEVSAIRAIAIGTTSVAEIKIRIGQMFSNKTEAGSIVCSTVHKAKGLERDRVWLLRNTFFVSKRAEEEKNIFYVACTRARRSLFIVK